MYEVLRHHPNKNRKIQIYNEILSVTISQLITQHPKKRRKKSIHFNTSQNLRECLNNISHSGVREKRNQTIWKIDAYNIEVAEVEVVRGNEMKNKKEFLDDM